MIEPIAYLALVGGVSLLIFGAASTTPGWPVLGGLILVAIGVGRLLVRGKADSARRREEAEIRAHQLRMMREQAGQQPMPPWEPPTQAGRQPMPPWEPPTQAGRQPMPRWEPPRH
jgi:hypothetical protein